MHKTDKVVINASPVIVLFKSGLLHILPRLFEIIVIPNQVITEIKAVLDDRAARKCAKTNSIKIIGTGHLLVLAAKKGVLKDFDQALNALKKSGFWISDKVSQTLKNII